MSLIGGPGQSSSKTTNNQTSVNTANYGGPGDAQNFNFGALTLGKKSDLTLSLSTSDYGAIGAGADLAKAALSTVADANQRAIMAVQSTSQSVIDKTLKIAAGNQVSEGAQFQQLLLYAGLIGAAAFVLVRFAK